MFRQLAIETARWLAFLPDICGGADDWCGRFFETNNKVVGRPITQAIIEGRTRPLNIAMAEESRRLLKMTLVGEGHLAGLLHRHGRRDPDQHLSHPDRPDFCCDVRAGQAQPHSEAR